MGSCRLTVWYILAAASRLGFCVSLFSGERRRFRIWTSVSWRLVLELVRCESHIALKRKSGKAITHVGEIASAEAAEPGSSSFFVGRRGVKPAAMVFYIVQENHNPRWIHTQEKGLETCYAVRFPWVLVFFFVQTHGQDALNLKARSKP